MNKILIIFFTLISFSLFSQTKFCKQDICVVEFNAEWNKANEVTWIGKLTDCQTIIYIDINTQKELQKKHKIAVIPTIIIFKDDVEVARFQADLSFKMVATREEVQDEINEQLMSDF